MHLGVRTLALPLTRICIGIDNFCVLGHSPDPPKRTAQTIILIHGLLDRGREGRLIGSPSLRTGLADLPHPALQLVVHLYQD